jgi:hypothetical protein
MHWQLPKKLWAHSHILVAIYNKNYGPIQNQQQLLFEKQWAHPYILGAAEKHMGPSTYIGSIYSRNYGPIQSQQQLLFKKQWAHP